METLSNRGPISPESTWEQITAAHNRRIFEGTKARIEAAMEEIHRNFDRAISMLQQAPAGAGNEDHKLRKELVKAVMDTFSSDKFDTPDSSLV